MVSERASMLHAAMFAQMDHLYTQRELEALLPVSDRDGLIDLLQELINNQMVKLAKSDSVLFYQAVSPEEAERVRGLSSDEALVYSYIQAAGREGIWTRTIKTKGNLHQNVVMRCLKSLENQRYIKAVKSVKFPTRKIYMLYNLQPSMEVTGGPWYQDSELDSEFIGQMLRLVWHYVIRATFPDEGTKIYAPGYAGYPSVEGIHSYVEETGVSAVELAVADIRALCNVLVADGKIEPVAGERYRATWAALAAEQGATTPASLLPRDVLPLISKMEAEPEP